MKITAVPRLTLCSSYLANRSHSLLFVWLFVCSWNSWHTRWRCWVAWYTDITTNWCECDLLEGAWVAWTRTGRRRAFTQPSTSLAGGNRFCVHRPQTTWPEARKEANKHRTGTTVHRVHHLLHPWRPSTAADSKSAEGRRGEVCMETIHQASGGECYSTRSERDWLRKYIGLCVLMFYLFDLALLTNIVLTSGSDSFLAQTGTKTVQTTLMDHHIWKRMHGASFFDTKALILFCHLVLAKLLPVDVGLLFYQF